MTTSITTIQGTDVISTSRTDINNNFDSLNANKIETSYLDTDTTLAANSDSKIATQKATKAYVDANVNPTGRSWNEYAADAGATDAYVITLSGVSAYVAGQTFKFKANTANTGACTLNINGLGAKTIKKDVSSDLATGDILANQLVVVTYDGTNMQLTSTEAGLKDATQLTGIISPTSLGGLFFPQKLFVQKEANNTLAGVFGFTSNTSGTVFYIWYDDGTVSGSLRRYAKDTISGMFIETHNVTTALLNQPSNGTNSVALIIAGNYLYAFQAIGGAEANHRYRRYDADTLANETTVSGGIDAPFFAITDDTYGFYDGSQYFYVGADSLGSTYTKFTVSGTTFTNASSSTTFIDLGANGGGMIYDGTYVYTTTFSNPTVTIKKYNISGTLQSTNTYRIQYPNGNASAGMNALGIIPNGNVMYIAMCSPQVINLATDENYYYIDLIPVTKP